MSNPVKPVLLLILDGYGYRAETEDNAIAAAKKLNIDRIFAENPWTLINASTSSSARPRASSAIPEVGHLNIGAGRVVLQDITRIDVDVAEGTMGQNTVLKTSTPRSRARKPCTSWACFPMAACTATNCTSTP